MGSTARDARSDDRLCDLHLHSTNSDGLLPPETVIELARKASLWAICLSDHSRPTFDDSVRELAARNGIVLLPGMEISTTHHGRKYHVLAYGQGAMDPELQEFAFRPTAIKNDLYSRILVDLRAEGIRLPAESDILRGIQAGGPPLHPGKWMLSSTLIGRYLAPVMTITPDAATTIVKERYNAGKYHSQDRYVPTENAVSLVRKAGAVPVIAHPFWECHNGRNSWDGVISDLGYFRSLGLAGVEVSSRHDSLADEERRTDAARRLGLVPFRSSDFHGNGKTEVGQFPMSARDLEEAASRCGVSIAAMA